MKKLYYIDVIFVIILALIVSTVLPSYVSYRQEQQLLNQTVIDELATVRVTRTEKMEEKSQLEKFAFLLEDGIEYIEYVSAEDGKAAEQALLNELQILFDMGVLPSGELRVISSKPYTAANVNNPAQSLVVWQFLVAGAFDESYVVTLDDATGTIISLKAIWLHRNMEDFYGPAHESVARMWGDYIGMSSMKVTDIQYVGELQDRLLKRMGNHQNQFMELYGIADEATLKEFIQEKPGVLAADNDRRSKTELRNDGIHLSVEYYMEDGTFSKCILEWDMNGYCFLRQES